MRERTLEVAASVAATLGADRVIDHPSALRKLSSDWSKMSPILQEKVPSGRYLADVVICPHSPDEVVAVLSAAYAAEVPVTPRGAGTGNYGQATPFDGGIILDLRMLESIEVNADASITAGAGSRLTDIDKIARAAGRDVWLYPSTKGSTVGGFISGGSAGTGTIEHGGTTDGFVRALTVAPMDGSGRLLTFRGGECAPYIHAYGVTGIVVECEIATDAARDWSAVYASFGSWQEMVQVHRRLLELAVLPRLASADDPALGPSLPSRVPLDPQLTSLRVIAEAGTVAEISRWVRSGAVRSSPRSTTTPPPTGYPACRTTIPSTSCSAPIRSTAGSTSNSIGAVLGRRGCRASCL